MEPNLQINYMDIASIFFSTYIIFKKLNKMPTEIPPPQPRKKMSALLESPFWQKKCEKICYLKNKIGE